MENRERDQVSQRDTPSVAGEINRHVEEEKGREHNKNADFGQKIGQAEKLEDKGKIGDATEGRH